MCSFTAMRMRIALAITWLVTLTIMMVNLWEVQKPCHQHSVASIPNDPESMFYHPDNLNEVNPPYTASRDCACGKAKPNVTVPSVDAARDDYKVPNIVHFIWYSFSTKPLEFHQMISILSASKIIKPDIIYFHTNLQPVGKFWLRVKQLPALRINYRKPPEKLFGERLKEPVFYTSHSNVDRLTILAEYGGIYLDLDVVVTKPFDDLRKHECTIGLESAEMACNSVIVCTKNSPFLLLWINSFLDDYQVEEWSYNSGKVPYKLSKRFPNLVNVEEDKLNRPNSRELTKIWGKEKVNWKENYAVHLWFRIWKTMSPLYPGEDPSEGNILQMDTTFGEISRLILYGDPGIVDHNAVTLNTEAGRHVTPTPLSDSALIPLHLRGAVRGHVRLTDQVMQRDDMDEDENDDVYEYDQTDDEEDYNSDDTFAVGKPHQERKTLNQISEGNIQPLKDDSQENPQAIQKETEDNIAKEYERKHNLMVDKFDEQMPLQINQQDEASDELVEAMVDNVAHLRERQPIIQQLLPQRPPKPSAEIITIKSQMGGPAIDETDKAIDASKAVGVIYDDGGDDEDEDDEDDDVDYDAADSYIIRKDLERHQWVNPLDQQRDTGSDREGHMARSEQELQQNLQLQPKTQQGETHFDVTQKTVDLPRGAMNQFGQRQQADPSVYTERPVQLSNLAIPAPPFERLVQQNTLPGVKKDILLGKAENINVNQPASPPIMQEGINPEKKELPSQEEAMAGSDQGVAQDPNSERRIHLGQFSHPELYHVQEKQHNQHLLKEAQRVNEQIMNQQRLEEAVPQTHQLPAENIRQKPEASLRMSLDNLQQPQPQLYGAYQHPLTSGLRAPVNPNSIVNFLSGKGGSPGGVPDMNQPLVESPEEVPQPRPGVAPVIIDNLNIQQFKKDNLHPPPIIDQPKQPFSPTLTNQRNPSLAILPRSKSPIQRYLHRQK